MKNTVSDKLRKRIAALLAKARSENVTEAEAASFAAKAAELLQAHNLEEADLGGNDANEPLITRNVSSVDWNPWRIGIISALAELYFSKIFISYEIYKGKQRRCVVLVGRPHNLDVAESMYEYLESTTIRLAKEYSADRKERLHFEKGCGMRLATRIKAMAAAAREPAPAAEALQYGGTTLPALYKTELQLAEDLVFKFCGGEKARASGHRGRSSAIAAGSRAGDNVNLGGQIGAGSSRASHLLTNG